MRRCLAPRTARRHAHYLPFTQADGTVIDQGIACIFKGRIHIPAKT
jgi:tRNA U34 5-carboxymethylaminomethyl modifying GTPase MnmE/TrmE